jgi:hypothetical protein
MRYKSSFSEPVFTGDKYQRGNSEKNKLAKIGMEMSCLRTKSDMNNSIVGRIGEPRLL